MAARALDKIVAVALLAALLLFIALVAQLAPAGAQSGGCAGGPFDGATATDSDGDGVADAVEVQTGTDECDPNSVPSLICGEYVSSYDPANFDADNDGFSDADEDAAGSDKCDSTSVIAAPTTAPPVVVPQLALTGPSALAVMGFLGILMIALGIASIAIGRQTET